jgi:hypothetical protein
VSGANTKSKKINIGDLHPPWVDIEGQIISAKYLRNTQLAASIEYIYTVRTKRLLKNFTSKYLIFEVTLEELLKEKIKREKMMERFNHDTHNKTFQK